MDTERDKLLEELKQCYLDLKLTKSGTYLTKYSKEQIKILLNICKNQPLDTLSVSKDDNQIAPHIIMILGRQKRHDQLMICIAILLEKRIRYEKISSQTRMLFFSDSEFSKKFVFSALNCDINVIINFLAKYYKYSCCKNNEHTKQDSCCKSAAKEDIKKMLNMAIENGAYPQKITALYLAAIIISENKETYLTRVMNDPLSHLGIEAEFELAQYYHKRFEYKRAKELYLSLIRKHKHAPSMVNLAKICEREMNIKDAKKYLREAVRADNVNAMIALGLLHKTRIISKFTQTNVIKYLQMACERGSVEAMYQLGLYYSESVNCVGSDKDAILYLEMANKRNHKLAYGLLVKLKNKIFENTEPGASELFNDEEINDYIEREDHVNVLRDIVVSLQNVTKIVHENEEKIQDMYKIHKSTQEHANTIDKIIEIANVKRPRVVTDLEKEEKKAIEQLNNELTIKKRRLEELTEMKKQLINL